MGRRSRRRTARMDKGKQAMENMKNIKMPQGSAGPAVTLLKLAAFTGAAVYGAYHSIYNVPAGHRAVVYSRIDGVNKEVIEQGTHFLLPWLQRPIIFDVRTRPHTSQSLTGTKDLQMINIGVRVLSKPDRGRLQWIYTHLGLDYDQKVLPSIVNEVAKQVVAQFTAAELIYQREHVSRLIAENLRKRADRFDILLDDVSIIHLNFGNEYTAAIEAKQVAQQDAERARFVVEKALQEKKSTIIRAQGVAKSAELVGEAIKANPAFVQLRRLDAAKEVANVISRSANKVYLNSDSLLLNLLHDSSNADSDGRARPRLSRRRRSPKESTAPTSPAATRSHGSSAMSTQNNDSWNSSDDRWQDFSGSSGAFGSGDGHASGTAGLEFPVLPTIPPGSIDLGSIAPVFGVANFDDDSADYLDYDKAGRPPIEQLNGSCGAAYLTGVLGGGAFGAVQGFRRSPSPMFKIRMNSLLNGASARGSKAGNALGCLTLLYKAFEYAADTAEIERFIKYDQVTPILASGATGLLYKSTAGPKAMILAGALGAGLMTVVQFGIKPFYPRL
ncbi:TPA: hypothetical protein N0F65_001944 [Lagenidium giganteum]|uniref:Band 7 domain-containing protein n=1 Tax=Lagenidium giganteum TaxID=4803 RepID=A0AAV2YZZ0_9STRA|nr:TPA: hypothetical protein N0F65_001944 [Lagenidium giganteum]